MGSNLGQKALSDLGARHQSAANVAIETLSDKLEIFDLCLKRTMVSTPGIQFMRRVRGIRLMLVYTCARVPEMVIRRVGSATSPEFATSMSMKRSVRETLGVLPVFPIVIWDIVGSTSDEDNIALERLSSESFVGYCNWMSYTPHYSDGDNFKRHHDTNRNFGEKFGQIISSYPVVPVDLEIRYRGCTGNGTGIPRGLTPSYSNGFS
ncbi:hypothetical protein BGY98DRAFT_933869 [Russula aff. rugulosa BPL654]|nr:hypothetical protein BGY98DRAFT_933869 [Russula aff. rugulosa BPL654]